MSEETGPETGPEERCCDVCLARFMPLWEEQRRCGETCRQFAHDNRLMSTKGMQNKWRQLLPKPPCPSGKVAHTRKKDALRSARSVMGARFRGATEWIRVYECPDCRKWHLTSKPARFQPPAGGCA